MPSFWENIRFPGVREMDELSGAQGQDMATYVSHPAPSEGNSFPAVIVIMEAFGVTRHIEQVCDEYARHGYVAVAPSLYHRQHPNAQHRNRSPLVHLTSPLSSLGGSFGE